MLTLKFNFSKSISKMTNLKALKAIVFALLEYNGRLNYDSL